MTELDKPSGISRRDLIKKSAIAGGLVWAAPTVLSTSMAQAGHTCSCPTGSSHFAVQILPRGSCSGIPASQNNRCVTPPPGTNLGGNCLCGAGFFNINFPSEDETATVSITSAFPNARIVQAFKKGGGGFPDGCSLLHIGGDCRSVTSPGPQNSHLELVVCIPGTIPSACT